MIWDAVIEIKRGRCAGDLIDESRRGGIIENASGVPMIGFGAVALNESDVWKLIELKIQSDCPLNIL